METNQLLQKEEKKLLAKITQYLGKRIEYMVKFDDWTKTEIAKMTGIGNNMITMYSNYMKYERCVSRQDLATFIAAGILTIQSMLKEIPALTEKEKKYIMDHGIFEDQALRKEYKLAKDAGLNPAEILKAARLKAQKK